MKPDFRIYPALTKPSEKKGNPVAELVTSYVFDRVLEWATGMVDLNIFHSLEELVDNRHMLSDGQFDLVRAALKDRPWVCLVCRPPLKHFEGLVFEPMPGFDHKGNKVVPVRYVEERREQGGCPH